MINKEIVVGAFDDIAGAEPLGAVNFREGPRRRIGRVPVRLRTFGPSTSSSPTSPVTPSNSLASTTPVSM